MHLLAYFTFAVYLSVSLGGEMTFELPDNEKQCFFESVEKGVESTLEFQVITGGQYDVDMELVSPNGKVLYKGVKKQYDSVTWKAEETGIFKFCFSNEFSTFTHKVVYFDLEVGDDDDKLFKSIDSQATAMTFLETSAHNAHEALAEVLDYQTHHRLRENQGRAFAEDLNQRVQLWSIILTVVIVITGVGQVLVLRSFFTDKKLRRGP
ncbi:transmembrane emp24 domain-containing protein 7-like isoform X2 [Dreissena polymorpha]|uniref:transmembrane emp24 domain-containing protein 7-like isoform X2 n=1 Tax=Dreissena polymorpha TaxID=45954 RepID=UPI0022653176|nr:transmembrane emp24 domain-containing protein 7-like isoform X2 [Dreissena polymorpha]